MNAQKPSFSWAALQENARFPHAPCLADAENHAISRTCVPIAHRPAQCAGYSVCNEFAHGLGPTVVWSENWCAEFHGIFMLVFLYNVSIANPGCKPLSGGGRAQNIPPCPTYFAGSAG